MNNCNRSRSVAPASTEICAAENDRTGAGRIVPPSIVNFKIGKDLAESLSSGRKDGNVFDNVAEHDAVFQKSDDHYHDSLGTCTLRNNSASLLIEYNRLPQDCKNSKRKNLVEE